MSKISNIDKHEMLWQKTHQRNEKRLDRIDRNTIYEFRRVPKGQTFVADWLHDECQWFFDNHRN